MSNTENRSSNTEMVSDMLPPCADDVFKNGVSACLVGDVPKHAAETICQSLSAITGWKIDWHYIGGRTHIKALAPAEQHQSERARLGDGDLIRMANKAAPHHDRDNDMFYIAMGRLVEAHYTHADTAGDPTGSFDKHMEYMDRCHKLEKKLAERDGLLRTVLNAFEGAEGHPWMPGHVAAQIKPMVTAALSASAEPTARELHALQIEKSLGIERLPVEPSAPVIHPINMKTMMQAYEQVDHKAMLHGTSNWCAAMATALRGTLHSETSAPVEPLYQKCTVLKDAEVRYSNSTAPVERDERAAYEAWHLSRGDCSGMSIHAWQAWQARAALERKS